MAKKAQNMVEVQGQALNENTRTVYLIDEVSDDTARNTIISLQALDESDGNIRLVLCTSGGEVDPGYAIHDCIRLLRNDVHVVGLGKVYSIGAVVLAAGDKRILTTHCKFMIHYGDVTLHGNNDGLPGTGTESKIDSRTMIALGKDLEEDNRRYIMLMSAYSGQSPTNIKDWCDKEVYFTAHQAVNYGFAHEVMKYESVSK